jgi:hypothetical protein
MNAMVLCPGCKRHVFCSEPACPFCGIGFASTNPSITPSIASELSRAQRYVVGAAIAASVATAGCSSPTVVHNPDEAGNVTVDVNETQSDRKARESLEVARDPDGDDNRLAAEEAARRAREERARREEEQRRLQLERQQELEDRQWRRGGQCVNGVCPPYGCVFPDEACDIIRV